MLANKNLYEYVLDHYGIAKQLHKTLEELEELKQEVLLFLQGKGDRVGLIGEIADVENMIEQLDLHYKLRLSVDNVRRQKMEREVDRILKNKEG